MQSSDPMRSTFAQAAFWKGVVAGMLGVVGVLAIGMLIMWLTMGRCPLCSQMMT